MQHEEAARIIRHSGHPGETGGTARHPVILKETIILCLHRQFDAAKALGVGPPVSKVVLL